MIIAIESADGDKLLLGKELSLDVLKSAVNGILKSYSEKEFTAAFCSRFGYRELPYSEGYAAYGIDLDTHLVTVPAYSFPRGLNGAKVLYYTDKGNFEPVRYPGGEIAHRVAYLAVCKYDGDEEHYVFHCDESLDVVADDCIGSLTRCEDYMRTSGAVWHKR